MCIWHLNKNWALSNAYYFDFKKWMAVLNFTKHRRLWRKCKYPFSRGEGTCSGFQELPSLAWLVSVQMGDPDTGRKKNKLDIWCLFSFLSVSLQTLWDCVMRLGQVMNNSFDAMSIMFLWFLLAMYQWIIRNVTGRDILKYGCIVAEELAGVIFWRILPGKEQMVLLLIVLTEA